MAPLEQRLGLVEPARADVEVGEPVAHRADPLGAARHLAERLAVRLDERLVDLDRAVSAYEDFVAAYASALSQVPGAAERVGAVRDGLADFYVSAGRLDQAEALFERRHDEDQGDVAVALSASRAFLAAGSISHAVRWLGIGAVRAATLGREELASRLRTKQERVRERLS